MNTTTEPAIQPRLALHALAPDSYRAMLRLDTSVTLDPALRELVWNRVAVTSRAVAGTYEPARHDDG